MHAIDQASIRQQNLKRIVDALIEAQPLTRQMLAEKTGLSLMSVSNLVDHLDRQGALLFRDAPRPDGRPQAGRKAAWISLSRARDAFLALDLMDRHFRYVALGLDGTVGEVGAPWPYDENLGYAENLAAFLRALAGDAALDAARALGVAVVAPGPYDFEADAVVNSRVPELNEIRIKRALREALGEVRAFVDEDVLFAARAHAGDGEELLFYLYIGEGVSGAIVQEGRIVRGRNGMAGEIGQQIGPGGESYEAFLRLDAVVERLLGADWARRDVDEMRRGLARCARERPADYARAMGEAVERLSDMLYNCIWLLDPARIVIDCLYAPDCEGTLARPLGAEMARRFAGSGKRLPHIGASDSVVKDAYLGAAEALRWEWIKQMV